MDSNQLEIDLLYNDPSGLILRYQPVIEVVVQVFMKSGHFRSESKDEIVQFVNGELLERIGRIREQYNGLSLLKTYLSAVVRNLCHERIRNAYRNDLVIYVEEPDETGNEEVDSFSRIVIAQEMERLDRLLALYYHRKPKIEVCLRALFRLPLDISDFGEWCGTPPGSDYREFVERLVSNHPMTEREVFRDLSSIFNLYEGREVGSDNMRKWVKARMAEIISLLNGDPRQSNYNEETLQILMEKYYMEKSNRMTSRVTMATGKGGESVMELSGRSKKIKNYDRSRR